MRVFDLTAESRKCKEKLYSSSPGGSGRLIILINN